MDRRASRFIVGFALVIGACGAEPSPPAVPAVATIEASEAQGSWRAVLERDELEGFVLVPREGAKWPSVDAARAGEGQPSDDVVVHRVLADHGEVVEVLPIDRADGDHCHLGTYESVGRLSVPGFVRKRDLVALLTDRVVVEGPDATRYEVGAGVRVEARGGDRLALAEGLSWPLPAAAPLGLGYTAARRAEPFAHLQWDGRGADPRVALLPGATLRAGGQTFPGSVVATHGELKWARSVDGEGERRRVTIAAGCVTLRATVAAEHLRAPDSGSGGAVVGIGRIGRRVGGGVVAAPPPKEHYAPAGTRLSWKSGATAGELAAAVMSYPVDAPVCVAVSQGFVGDPEVCFAASAVVRDCRAACEEHGRCSVSDDGARCVAAAADRCRASRQCELRGACSLRGDRCEAAADADCSASFYCEEEPHACMAHEGRCVVTPNPDCEHRPACTLEGRCVADERGACVAGRVTDCAASEACARQGRCGEVGGRCAPRQNAHCRQSALCREEGRCALKGSACVVSSAEDCRQSAACREQGACGLAFDDGPTWLGGLGGAGRARPQIPYCAPTGEEDCQAARACRRPGCRVETTSRRTYCVF